LVPNGFNEIRELLRNGPAALWYVDKEARTLPVTTPNMAEMLGTSLEDMVGKSIFDFCSGKWLDIAERHFQNRMGGSSAVHAFIFTRTDGTELPALLTTTPITDHEGNTVGAVAKVERIPADSPFFRMGE
jgi:two-component system, NtrC family, sensor kinase